MSNTASCRPKEAWCACPSASRATSPWSFCLPPSLCPPSAPSDAERFGLVNHLTEPGQALKRALELATSIAHNAPLAVTAVKRVVTERRAFSDQDAFVEQDRIVAPVLASHDVQEGAHAFTERRPPHWQGC
ncbi:enoyl-CoA hydratase-related protein [Streptomyces sp. NPDC056653]|uniref:enoyl-CoA hydratase-related protein n=1 Tax=Streptomyces sp. NPDC056653 TaxID=3345894 RepID=UPI0036AF5981